MHQILKIFDWRTYLFTVVAVLTFSNFMVVLFGHTIPGGFVSFFRYAGEIIILGAVFLFALSWLLKARPHNRPKKYSIVAFDVYGNKNTINDIRTDFKTHDVAWSFMKQYKESYPLYNFAMVATLSKSDRPTIFRYI